MKKQFFISLLSCLMLCSCSDDSTEKAECTQDADCESQKCLSNQKCAQIASEGEECSDDIVCQTGLECTNNHCTDPSKSQPDNSCSEDKDCSNNSVCIQNECTPVKQLDEGDECNPTDKSAVCAENLICYRNKCMTQEDADKCVSDEDCASEPDEHTTCLPSGLCGAVRTKGEKCGGDQDLCNDELECNDNICIQRSGVDEPCNQNEWIICNTALFCVDGTCKTEPKPEPIDPGPQEEVEAATDDSDVLNDNIKLPQKKAIPDNPCLKCGFDQECSNGKCIDSTRHYVTVYSAFTNENGGTIQGTFSIPPKPLKDVRVECELITDSPYPEATIDCSQIVIPAGDVFSEGVVQPGKELGDLTWQTHPKPFTITGIPDDVDDDIQKYIVLMKTVSEDATFNNIVHSPLNLTSRNVDTAGVIWDADHVLQTGEDGSSTTYTLRLQSKPQAPVKLKLRSSDITEGTVEPKFLIFTQDNWKQPQTVTVTGVDDEFKDEAFDYAILTTAVSKDPKYNGIDVPKVRITNIDNDTAGISISKSGYKISPTSPSLKASVTLNAKPSANVSVLLNADDASSTALLKAVPNKIEFTPENWNQPQAVQLEVANFENAQSAITTVCVTGSADTDDEDYLLVSSNTVCIDIYRYAALNFAYKGAEDKVALVPGEYTLEVWGGQGASSVNARGGFGGYSHGTIEFKQTTDVYINVGGSSLDSSKASYNGGGRGQANGGGATHMALVSGILPTLSDKRDKVLIVAGGGGGGERNVGGFGGGNIAGDGSKYNTSTIAIPTGAKNDAGGVCGEAQFFGKGTNGTFGQGGDATGIAGTQDPANIHAHIDQGGAGGGGWFGGGGIPYAGGGGGGTGHIGDAMNQQNSKTLPGSGEYTFPSPTGGTEIGHVGDGYARISIIERPEPVIN